jgi:hypothetical protein
MCKRWEIVWNDSPILAQWRRSIKLAKPQSFLGESQRAATAWVMETSDGKAGGREREAVKVLLCWEMCAADDA